MGNTSPHPIAEHDRDCGERLDCDSISVHLYYSCLYNIWYLYHYFVFVHLCYFRLHNAFSLLCCIANLGRISIMQWVLNNNIHTSGLQQFSSTFRKKFPSWRRTDVKIVFTLKWMKCSHSPSSYWRSQVVGIHHNCGPGWPSLHIRTCHQFLCQFFIFVHFWIVKETFLWDQASS